MNTKTICRIMLSMVFVIVLLSCSNEEEMSPIEREMHEMLRGTWLHDWGPDAETDHTFYTFDNGTGTLCEGTKEPQSFRYIVNSTGAIKLFFGTNTLGTMHRIKNLCAESMDFDDVKLCRVEDTSIGSVYLHRISGDWECFKQTPDILGWNYLTLRLFDSWMTYSQHVLGSDENESKNITRI